MVVAAPETLQKYGVHADAYAPRIKHEQQQPAPQPCEKQEKAGGVVHQPRVANSLMYSNTKNVTALVGRARSRQGAAPAQNPRMPAR